MLKTATAVIIIIFLCSGAWCETLVPMDQVMVLPVHPIRMSDCIEAKYTTQFEAFKAKVDPNCKDIDFLNCYDAYTTTQLFDFGADLCYVAGTANLKNRSYKLIQDTGKFINILDDGGVIHRVGICCRIVATFTQKGGSIDINGIGALGVAAKLDQVDGQFCFQAYGLSGEKIEAQFPNPCPISEETLTLAQQATAVIMSKLRDPTTKICPLEIGIGYPVQYDKEKKCLVVDQGKVNIKPRSYKYTTLQ